MIKKMIKGEKGFTLVELLAVIVILGIIVAIAIPAIGKVIENAQGDANESTELMIVDAARLYEMQEHDEATGLLSVTVGELEAAGYLDERQGDLTGLSAIKIEKDADGNYSYDGRTPGETPTP